MNMESINPFPTKAIKKRIKELEDKYLKAALNYFNETVITGVDSEGKNIEILGIERVNSLNILQQALDFDPNKSNMGIIYFGKRVLETEECQ